MTQHAGTIANQAGASFRGDLNNLSAAILSAMAGTSAPSTTYANMWWADTTNNLLKQRNNANSAWITRGALADWGIQSGAQVSAVAGGTANAITIALTPTVTAFFAGPKWWRTGASANSSTTPTLQTDALAAKTIVKGNNAALAVGDIPANTWMCSVYDVTLDKEVLLNPAYGVLSSSGGYMLLQHQLAQGTDGGSAASGVNTRPLNTTVANTITGASLASNQFTLPAGTFELDGVASTYASNGNKAYFYNVTSSLTYMGQNQRAAGGGGTGTLSRAQAFVVLAAPAVFELRHYYDTAAPTNGYGTALGAGGIEVYATVNVKQRA